MHHITGRHGRLKGTIFHLHLLCNPPPPPTPFLPSCSLAFQTNRCVEQNTPAILSVYSSLFAPRNSLLPSSISPRQGKCQPSHPLLSKAPQSQQHPPNCDRSSHVSSQDEGDGGPNGETVAVPETLSPSLQQTSTQVPQPTRRRRDCKRLFVSASISGVMVSLQEGVIHVDGTAVNLPGRVWR